jgi:hypothetical protein
MRERNLILGEAEGQNKKVRKDIDDYVKARRVRNSRRNPRLKRGGLQQTLRWPQDCCSPGLQTMGFRHLR